MKESITTISFFKYAGFRNKLWGFGMMQYAHKHLSEVKGLRFYKLMGSGKDEGFNPFPDWSTYTLLTVWDSEADADIFHQKSKLSQLYKERTEEVWTLYMKSIVAKGEWSQQNPFEPSQDLDAENPLLAVITRATIRVRRLYSFWKYVPTSHLSLHGNEGLIYTKGIGEMPVIQMATFSIWKDKASLMKFAYQGKEHRVAIEKTKKLDWYKEEMFSRFQPYRSEGTWEGVEPLKEYLL